MIKLQVLLRLPCYDFFPVAILMLGVPLRTYLVQEPHAMDWILNEIFKKDGISELRCVESHNLGDTIQDKLDEGLYALVDQNGVYYCTIEEIFYIQSDLYLFISLTMHIALLKRNTFKGELLNHAEPRGV